MSEEISRAASVIELQKRDEEIRRLNKELRREIAEYDMLMESTGVCIVKLGLTEGYPVEWCNEAAMRVIGYTREAYEARFGQDLQRFFQGYESEYHTLQTTIEEAVQQRRGRFDATLRVPTKTGFIWAQGSGTFTDFEEETGVPTAIYSVFTDITSFVKAREKLSEAKLEADRANAAKSAFLSGMSHDLRTPLNGILSFTEFALKERDAEKRTQYLEKIQQSGRLLLDLVNDTLDLSRIESGKMLVEPEAVSAEILAESALLAVRPLAEQKHIRMLVDTEAVRGRYFWADRLKIQKIILNLLSNAVKYTPEGGTVRYVFEPIEPPAEGRTCRILVEDTGIGMYPEFLKKLYEPFSQEGRKETAGTVGTGLGLSIVRKILNLLEGTIEVQSEVGKGSRFTVELPVLPAEKGRDVQRTERESLVQLKGKRVLLCEDNQLNREIAVMLLQESGLLTECACNGREGVEFFERSAPGYYQAILMDIRMPVMDGYAATQAIRALRRDDSAVIPIIAMSADVFEEDMRQAVRSGMDDFVTKPIDPPKLCRVLQKHIL